MKYNNGVLSDPAVVGGVVGEGSALRLYAASAILWLMGIWLFNSLIKISLRTKQGRRLVTHLSDTQRESFCMWILELIVSTVSLTLVAIYARNVLINGTFFGAIISDTPETNWSDELIWIAEMRSITNCFGYAVQPIIFLYIFEVMSASPIREVSSQHHLITAHHFMCILLNTFGVKALGDTLSASWARMGFACFLHMVCEQHTWVSLIMYRLKIPGYGRCATLSVVSEVLLRIVLWSFCFYVYYQLTFAQCTFTQWEVLWRYAFPPAALFLIFAQAATIRIHLSMAKKAGKEERETNNASRRADARIVERERTLSTLRQRKEAKQALVAPLRMAPVDAEHPHRETAGEIIRGMSIPGLVLALLTTVVILLFYGVEVIPLNSSIVEVRCKNIAVVGSGITGLGTVWSLARSDAGFRVDVFEANNRLGGNAHSEEVNGVAMELGFAAMLKFHNLEMLFEELGVAVSQHASGESLVLEYPNGSYAILGNSISTHIPNSVRKLDFSEESARLTMLKLRHQFTLSEAYLMRTTLGQYTLEHNFTELFRNVWLPACMQSYVGTATNSLLVPIGVFFWFEDAAGGCTQGARVPYRAVKNGSSEYIRKLHNLFKANPRINVHLSTRVEAVKHSSDGVELFVDGPSGPQWKQYDQVVFATHRDQSLKILTDPRSSTLSTPRLYATALGSNDTEVPVTYQNYMSFVHTDGPSAERRLRGYRDREGCWDIERYTFHCRLTAERGISDPLEYSAMLMSNSIEYPLTTCVKNLTGVFRVGVKGQAPDDLMPPPETILFTDNQRHAAHDVYFFASARAMHAIQGLDNMWFGGGSYVINLHELCFLNGLVVAEALGAPYPFEDHSGGRASFVRLRNFIRYGLQYVLPPTASRGNRTKRCAWCI